MKPNFTIYLCVDKLNHNWCDGFVSQDEEFDTFEIYFHTE